MYQGPSNAWGVPASGVIRCDANPDSDGILSILAVLVTAFVSEHRDGCLARNSPSNKVRGLISVLLSS